MAVSIKETYKKMRSSQRNTGHVGHGKITLNLSYAKINSDMKEFDRDYQKKVAQSYEKAKKIVLTS